jgi:hypothetical protein
LSPIGRGIGKTATGTQQFLTGKPQFAFQKAAQAGGASAAGNSDLADAFNTFAKGNGDPVDLSQRVQGAVQGMKSDALNAWKQRKGALINTLLPTVRRIRHGEGRPMGGGDNHDVDFRRVPHLDHRGDGHYLQGAEVRTAKWRYTSEIVRSGRGDCRRSCAYARRHPNRKMDFGTLRQRAVDGGQDARLRH